MGKKTWLRRELLYHGNSSSATPMEEVCGPHTMLKNKPHYFGQIRTLDHSQRMNISADPRN